MSDLPLWAGRFAFTLSPVAIIFCAALLSTRGCCGAVRVRRFTVLLAALACGGASWFAAACTRWGLAGDAASQLKAGSLLAPYDADVEFSILVAPFFLAVLLGCYALVTVGLKLFRFNDCEEASEELTGVRCMGV
jgi:hypothetical protein